MSPDADVSFEFHAEAGWYNVTTPNVVSVTVNGQDVPNGTLYQVDQTFPSYSDAKAMFVPLAVVITTTTDQRTFSLTLGQCDSVPNFSCSTTPPAPDCPEAVTSENDHYFAEQDPTGAASVNFYADCGQCGFQNGHTAGWCARSL